MKIRLLKPWSGRKAGTEITAMHRGMQLTLVQRGFAELIEDGRPPPKKKATKKKASKKKASKKKTPDPPKPSDEDKPTKTETQPTDGPSQSAGQRRGRKKATQHRAK